MRSADAVAELAGRTSLASPPPLSEGRLHGLDYAASLAMSQARTVILSAARTPFGKLGGGLASLSGPELGTHAAAAALERSGVAPGDIGYVVMGEVLQAGAGQIPSRQVSVGIGLGPTVGLGDDQQGVRVGHAGRDAGRRDDPGGRARRDPGRRDGVDVERALPPAEGPVRLRHGRRRGARLDDLRRAHLHLRRPDHGRAELGRGRRGRDLARGAGRLGAALARASRRGHRRRPVRRGDRAGHDPGPQGRDGGRHRRGPAPRHVARAAGRAEARLRRRRLDHGRERARA